MQQNNTQSNSIFNTANRKKVRMNFADSITASTYNLIIGGVLLYGFIVTQENKIFKRFFENAFASLLVL